MKLLKVLKNRKYLAYAVLFSLIIGITYPIIQSYDLDTHYFGHPDIWFMFITPLNLILFISFAILFGISISLQIYEYNRRKKKCDLKSLGSGSLGSVIGFLTVQCPSCLTLMSLLLPFNAAVFLAVYATELILIGIAMLLASIYFLGGFKNG